MNKWFLIFCVLIVLTSCKSVENYNVKITSLHTIEDLRTDVDKVYNQLKKHHPKLYQYTPKSVLDFKIDSLKKSITTPINSRAFYKKLAPVITHVRQGHISVGSANKRFSKKEFKRLKKNTFEFYNLDFEYLNDKLWVTHTRGKDSTYIGSEVVKINDELVADLVKTYKTRFTSDGYNKTLYNRVVGRHFSTFYYKDKGVVDSLKITLKNKDSLFTKTLKRIPKKKKRVFNDSLKVEKPKKRTKEEIRLAKIKSKQQKKENRKRGFYAKRKEYNRNLDFIGKDSTVAYMKIRSFTKTNYKRFYKESFKKIDSAKTKHFVLDLRDNGGGRVAEIDYLYSYLIDKEYQFIEESEVNSRVLFLKSLMSNSNPMALKIIGGLFTPVIVAGSLLHTKKKDDKLYFKFKQTKVRQPKDLNFKGKMYVLINGKSFSASSLISTHLKAEKRAVFVGEETGGAYNGCVAGFYKIYKLPTSKLKVRIGLMQIEAPQKQSPDGYGIKPDVEIIPTIEDRLSNEDPELNWVLDDIYKKD
ncbi:MAG: S41 family peptidase [Algibacter sp.]